MASNMVKLVVQLLADAKDFATELGKGAKAVEELAKETSTAMEAAAVEINDSMDKAAAAVEELKTETTADSDTMAKEMIANTEKTEKHYIDAQGRMRAANGRFVKQGSDEWKQAMAEMGQATDKTENRFQRFVSSCVAGAKKVVSGLKTARDAVNRVAEDVSMLATRVGVVFTAMGAAISGALIYAAKGAADFKMEMAGAFALLDAEQQTPTIIAQLTKEAQELRMEFGLTGKEVAAAMRVAIGSGIEATKQYEFLRNSAKAARSGMVDLADVVQVTAGVLKAYNLATDQTGRVQDALAKAVNVGTVEWSHFKTGLGQLLPFAAQLSLEIEELGGLIAALTLKGVPAEQAMTSLKAVFMGLLNPQEKQLQLFKQLGIELRDSAGKAKPFLTVMKEIKDVLMKKTGAITFYDEKEAKKAEKAITRLQEKIKDLNEDLRGARTMKERTAIQKKLADANKELDRAKQKVSEVYDTVAEKLDKDGTVAALFGDVNAKAMAVALLSDDMEALNKVLEQTGDSAGAVNEQWAAWSRDNPALEAQKTAQAFQVLRETIGNAVNSVFGPFIAMLRVAIKHFIDWAAANPKLAEGLVMVATAAGAFFTAVGVGLLGLAGLAAVIATLTTIGLPALLIGFGLFAPLIAVAAGAVALVVANFDKLKEWVLTNWPAIRENIVRNATVIWQSLQTVGQQVLAVMKQYGAQLIAWLSANLPAILEWITKATQWIATVLIPKIGEFVIWFIQKVASVFKWLSDNWPEIKRKLVENFTAVKDMFSALWDAITKVWDALVEIIKVLEKVGVFDHWLNQAQAMAKAFEVLAKVIGLVADRIKSMAKAVTDFVNGPSWGKFFKLIAEFALMLNPAGALLSNMTGGGGTAATLKAPLTPSSPTSALTRGSNVSSNYMPGGGGTTVVENHHYEATVYQRDNEDSSQMLTRLARELQRKRGR